jgi:Domain of unknown function (DUF4382)
MRLHLATTGAAKAFWVSLFVLLLSYALAGCGGSYCIVGIFSPSGTTTTMNPTCPVGNETGNMAVTFGSALSASDSALLRTPHIFVTLRGIDGLGAPMRGSDAPGWQELAPQLINRPVQIDLTTSAGSSCATGLLGSAAVPAGVYRQLRLHLVPNPSEVSAWDTTPTLRESACGADAFSCFIPPNGSEQLLTWDDPGEVVIGSDHITDGFIRVLPESRVHVSIALDLGSSLVRPDGAGLRLLSSFSVSAQSDCPQTE